LSATYIQGYTTEDPTTRRTSHSKTLVYKSGFSYVHPLEGGSDSARTANARAAMNSNNMPRATGMIIPGEDAGMSTRNSKIHTNHFVAVECFLLVQC